jgi:hypothetical protein
MPKHAFSAKSKIGEKISCQQEYLLAFKWKDTRDIFFLTSAHEDEVVEAPMTRTAHNKIKPMTVFNYNKY